MRRQHTCRMLLMIGLVAVVGCNRSDEDPEFYRVYDKWSMLNDELYETQQAFNKAQTPVERQQLGNQVSEVATQMAGLLQELRVASIAAYKRAPNADEKVADTLLNFANADAERDHYDEAVEIVDLLTSNNCQMAGLHEVAGSTAYAAGDFAKAGKYLGQAEKRGILGSDGAALLQDVPTATELWAKEQTIRKQEAEADDLPRVELQTSVGNLVLELFENEAPKTVANFVSLVDKGFYDGLTFHRVISNFMAQGGCPLGTGSGDPGYKIPCEWDQPNHRKHFRGSLAMARTSAKNSGGCQFYICFSRTADLDGGYTVFGRVLKGLDVLPKINRGEPPDNPTKIVKATVLRKRDHTYEPTKVAP